MLSLALQLKEPLAKQEECLGNLLQHKVIRCHTVTLLIFLAQVPKQQDLQRKQEVIIFSVSVEPNPSSKHHYCKVFLVAVGSNTNSQHQWEVLVFSG